MKFRMLTLIAMALLLALLPVGNAFADPYDPNAPFALMPEDLYAQAAVVMDANSGRVLFDKNATEQVYPASTTKIMTLLLACEYGHLDETITIPEEAADISSDSSVVPVTPGETMRFIDLLYGLEMHSGNDAANAVAVIVAGSIPNFVAMMNQKAEELGLTNTHFENCTGLHNDNHYSTCRDIAVLMSECLKSDTFREIVTREVYTTEATASHPEGITLYDTMLHRFTSYEMSTTLENGAVIEGGKTGFTDEAGQCLVSFAEYGGEEYILVTAEAMTDSGSAVDSIADASTVYGRLQ